MALTFDASTHVYALDGQRLPSVTQILNAAGLILLNGVPPYVLEAAKQRGAAVHQLIHFANEDDLDWASVDEAYRPYLDAWQRFRVERQLAIHLCEHRLVSRRHRVAGTLDVLGTIDGEGWLIDVKSGNPEDVAADLQTAAYLGLALEWQADDPRLAAVLAHHARWRRAAVRVQKTGAFRVTEYTDPRDYSQFQILAAAWHIRQARGALVTAADCAA